MESTNTKAEITLGRLVPNRVLALNFDVGTANPLTPMGVLGPPRVTMQLHYLAKHKHDTIIGSYGQSMSHVHTTLHGASEMHSHADQDFESKTANTLTLLGVSGVTFYGHTTLPFMINDLRTHALYGHITSFDTLNPFGTFNAHSNSYDSNICIHIRFIFIHFDDPHGRLDDPHKRHILDVTNIFIHTLATNTAAIASDEIMYYILNFLSMMYTLPFAFKLVTHTEVTVLNDPHGCLTFISKNALNDTWKRTLYDATHPTYVSRVHDRCSHIFCARVSIPFDRGKRFTPFDRGKHLTVCMFRPSRVPTLFPRDFHKVCTRTFNAVSRTVDQVCIFTFTAMHFPSDIHSILCHLYFAYSVYCYLRAPHLKAWRMMVRQVPAASSRFTTRVGVPMVLLSRALPPVQLSRAPRTPRFTNVLFVFVCIMFITIEAVIMYAVCTEMSNVNMKLIFIFVRDTNDRKMHQRREARTDTDAAHAIGYSGLDINVFHCGHCLSQVTGQWSIQRR